MQSSRTFSGTIRAFFSSARVWLILCLFIAWGLRLYHLDTMSFWWDESLTWDRATNTLANILSNTIFIQDVATRDLHPPLYFFLLHFGVLVTGTTEFALRFFSAFANLLTLALLYPLAQLLFKRKFVSLVTVLLATFSPFYVWYAQEARPYALVLFWSTLTVYALLRWLKTNPQTWRALLSRWFPVMGAGMVLTLATHYLSFVLLPFFAATVLIYGNPAHSGRARLASITTLLAIVLLFAFIIILILLPRGTQDLASWDQAGASFVPFFIMLRDVWNSFFVGVTGNLDEVVLLELFLVALWLVGIFSTLRVRSREFRTALFLLCYLFVPAIALQAGSYLRPLYLNSRHLITISPAFYIGLAVGVDALARRLANVTRKTTDTGNAFARHSSSVVYIVTAALLMLPVLGGAFYALHNLYFNAAYAKDNHKAWAQFLRERLRPDDYLLLVAPQAEKIVEYYAPEGLQWESLPHLGQTQDWQVFLDRESVVQALRHHGRVWFLEIHQPVGDPKFVINNLLHRYSEAVDIVYFPAIASRIILQQFVYRGPEQKPNVEIPQPVQITFDENLELRGFDAPPQMEPGTRAAVKLYWRLREKMPNDVSVSLRVTDASGQLWGQWDAPPIGNLYPVSKWNARTIYLDQHDLVVDPGAPPGKYNIELKVYHAASNEPLLAQVTGDGEPVESISLAALDVTRPQTPRDPRTLVIDQHTDVPFGSTARFVGFDQEYSAAPGGAIPLHLYFQVTQNSAQNISGNVELAAPWWQFWNRTRTTTPFTIDLTQREIGDIVQVNTGARISGDANEGTYELRLSLDGLAPQAPFAFNNTLTFAGATVETMTRSTKEQDIPHPLRARLGDSIEFLGYDMAAPDPLQPGSRVKLKLYWRALKTMDTSYKVFTHLIDAQNGIFGQQDKEPLDGARPTTSWASGETFSDTYEFEVAPNAGAGTYQIEIGMYNPADFKRLPTYDANGAPTGDRIVFGELRIP